MLAKRLSALRGLEIPKKLLGMLSWVGLALALFVAAVPWTLERLVQSRMQQQLLAHGANFAHGLQVHLDASEQIFQRQAAGLDNENGFDQLATRWLGQYPEILQVVAYSASGMPMRTLLNEQVSGLPVVQRSPAPMLPLQLLALQRADETRRPARSALYNLWGVPVTDLYLPLNKGPYALVAVTLDTVRWQGAADELTLPENIGVEVIPFTSHPNSSSGHLVNDSAWDGLWSLRFHNRDATLSALQSLQPFFVVLAAVFCLLVFFSVRNLRDRVLAEEALEKKLLQLEQQARLSTLGEMSASIAHEINQPLAAIANYSVTARLLMRSGKDATEIEPVLLRIEEQSQRAARVMRSVRALVHRDPVQERSVELGNLLKALKPHLELLTYGSQIAVVIRSPQDLWVRADTTLLEQVFLNLVRNSVQALGNVQGPHKRISLEGFTRHNEVCVEVRDNGPGVPPESAAHIFDSFFTTRTDGLGVGLNFCRSVLERFAGRIELVENSAEGASFLITLPATTNQQP